MPRHQDVRERDGDSFKPLYLTAAECCQHLYRDKVLVVSHRWDRRDAPDPSGTQMKALKRHLRANPNYEYVWVDFSCMPQGDRTPEESEAFGRMLANINLLFLGSSVLILLDMSYSSRFWTQFECWTSFQEVDSDGVLGSASEANRRCAIVCIHNANEYTRLGLIDMWSNKTPEEAHQILSRDDVSVTNQRDKEQQLPKIRSFQDHVHATWAAVTKEEEEDISLLRQASQLSTSRQASQRKPAQPHEPQPVGASTPTRKPSSPGGVAASPSFSPGRFLAEDGAAEKGQLAAVVQSQAAVIEQMTAAHAQTVEQMTKTIDRMGSQIAQISLSHAEAATRAHTELADNMNKQSELISTTASTRGGASGSASAALKGHLR